MLKKTYLCILLTVAFQAAYGQERPEAIRLQKMVASVVKKVMPATIKIGVFDTLSQTLAVSRFSGVVVSSDGLILTAAHATQPKQIYQVCFPNGRKVLAKGLGRVSLGMEKPATDVAMLQIIEKGKWPFAEMGYSSEMRSGQPCVGISFPGTFEQKLPNIRLGRLEDINIEKGNFQSSSKMEPGDSGGALFDADGRLIGIHSWILPNEKQNFEVPIDLYRRYWDALHIPITYDHLPQGSTFAHKAHNTIADGIMPLDSMFIPSTEAGKSVVSIRSVINSRVQFLLGTSVRIGTGGRAFSAIITKSSMIGDQILISVSGKQVKGILVARDLPNDLALLIVNENLPNQLNINRSAKGAAPQTGALLFSALPDGKVRTGIASTGMIEMLLKYSSGYFGANASFINGKVTITSIAKGCPADGILQVNDQVLAVNGVSMERPEQYGKELAKYYPNDSVTIDAMRGGKNLILKVKLVMYRPIMHTADGFPGGRSLRSDGFKKVIAQDGALRPSECGGPVFDAKGCFVGINIGRHSRVSTIIMPVEILARFCDDYIVKVIERPSGTELKM